MELIFIAVGYRNMTVISEYDDSANDVELKIKFGEYFPVLFRFCTFLVLQKKQMKVYIPFRTATVGQARKIRTFSYFVSEHMTR